MVEQRTSAKRTRGLRVSIAGCAAIACVSCTTADDRRSDLLREFPHLSNETYRGVLSCTHVPPGQIERVLVASAHTASDIPLPDDIEFTAIETTSAAGWTVEPVAIIGEPANLPFDDLLIGNPDPPFEYEIVGLPFTPDRTQDFALGGIVDVPANSVANPPAAITITGARYETGGESYVWEFDREVFVSRLPIDDPEHCRPAREPGTILDE